MEWSLAIVAFTLLGVAAISGRFSGTPVTPAMGRRRLAYGTASALGGSGFIAAFVAGMVFRLALGRDPDRLNDLGEQVGNVLNGVTFVLFGAILLGPALGELSWELAL